MNPTGLPRIEIKIGHRTHEAGYRISQIPLWLRKPGDETLVPYSLGAILNAVGKIEEMVAVDSV